MAVITARVLRGRFFDAPTSVRRHQKKLPIGGRVLKEPFIQQPAKEHPTLGCSFAYVGVQTQCTETVRIIAPS